MGQGGGSVLRRFNRMYKFEKIRGGGDRDQGREKKVLYLQGNI